MKMTLKFWTDKPCEKPVIVPLDTESKLDAEKIAFELAGILNARHSRQSLIDATSVYTNSEVIHDSYGDITSRITYFEFMAV